MTISSSLNAGVTGLNVNATRLATISDNIANSATYGYKRATADFHSLVIDQNRGTYSAGGVRVTTGRAVSQRGTLVTTNNSTDLAVAGRGMLPVTPATNLDKLAGEPQMLMTTTGSFKRDDQGFLVNTAGQALLGWPAEKDGTIPAFPRDAVGGLVPVRVETSQYVGDPTTNINLGINLPADETKDGASGAPIQQPFEYYGNLGESQSLDFRFTPTLPAPGGAATNTWQLEIFDSASGGAQVGDFTIAFDSSRASGGTIAVDNPATAAANDGVAVNGGLGAWDPNTGRLTIQAQSGPITLDIGKPLEARGLKQLSGGYAPTEISKDGSPVGNLTSVEVDANGKMHAVYDTGITRAIYQIPVVDVPNLDGLEALPNQTYQVSGESGAFYLWDAGDGTAGSIAGFAREESTTDVAAELTNLIQTQRAYSSNAKVIQTVDEMLQETTNIKR